MPVKVNFFRLFLRTFKFFVRTDFIAHIPTPKYLYVGIPSVINFKIYIVIVSYGRPRGHAHSGSEQAVQRKYCISQVQYN